MILLASLLFAQAASASPAPPPVTDQIVVMAERLRAISAEVGRDQEGRWHCSWSASSGNARIDDRLCRAATACSRRHVDEPAQIDSCIEQRRPGILDDFRRSLARSER